MTRAAGDRRPEAATVGAVRALLQDAIEVYRDDPVAVARLREQRERLDQPLRVALVGRVKAGKSTLLNALVGERLAPTDAGECTRVVTLYRHGAVRRVALTDRAGHARTLPVRRVDGALDLDLEGAGAADVETLVVDWPAPALMPMTLVDTPGISSLSADTSGRTRAFFESDARMPGADAVVFLTRQMQPEDLSFLSSFQADTGAAGSHITTITVLSRADEVGSGRLDALRAAESVARRMAADPAVRAVSQAVVPVSGQLALAGRLVRQGDFTALRSLALADPRDVETMLLTADRFVREQVPVPLSRAVRTSLLERFGLFGLRLSVVLVRAGIGDVTALSEELLRLSGVTELERLLAVRFTCRGSLLKAGAALTTIERLLRQAPRPGTRRLWAALEQVRVGAHDLVELSLLARARSVAGLFPAGLREEGERLLGAEGSEPWIRLGLPPDAAAGEIRAAALEALARWRAEALDPLAERGTADAADVVVRSLESMLGAAGSAVAQPGADGRPEQQG